MRSDAGSDAFRGKRRREEPHQFLSSAGQGTTSKRRKPDNSSGDDGSMESKYGAAASRMMASMGFKPGTGLGKDGQGIVAPLEGVSRPAHAGLGSVDEHRPFFHGKENLPPPPPPPANEDAPEPPRWSRKAGAARKSPAPLLVLSKSALLTTRAEQDEQVQPMVVDRVVDMRGPQPRVLTDLTALNDEQEMEVDEHLPMPELQYNLRVLVDQAAAGIRGLDEQLQQEKEDVASLMREKTRLAEQEASHGHELRVMEAITGVIHP